MPLKKNDNSSIEVGGGHGNGRKRLPIYENICRTLIEEITREHVKPHERFMTLGDICTRFETSKITAQRVLLELVQRGYLYTRPGSGSYIAPRVKREASNLVAFLQTSIGGSNSSLPLDDHTLPVVIRGAEACARENGYNLILCNASGDINLIRDYVNNLLDQRIDGILFDIPQSLGAYENPTYEIIRMLEARKVPVALLSKRFLDANEPMAYVGTENYNGAMNAIKHLVDLGHRYIATMVETNTSSTIERVEGYRGGVLKHGAVYQPNLVKEFDTLDDLPRCVNELLMLPNPPTAIFCEHDLAAREVMKVLQSRGLSIPEDMAIVGFDDHPFSKYLNPPLTTIRQPLEQLGREAMKVLIHRIREDFNYKPQILLETELIIRESTKAVKPHRTHRKKEPQKV